MIKSMTGFGKGEVSGRLGVLTVEMRTVNHRYFDLSSRIPNGLVILEDRIKDVLRRRVKRGKVNFFLSHRSAAKEKGPLTFDQKAVARYYKMLSLVKKKFKLKDDIKLSHIISFRDVITQEQDELDANSAWPWVEKAIEKAAADCDRMRAREGKVIYEDLVGRIGKIRADMDKISKLAPLVVSEYKSRLDRRLKDLLKTVEVDKQRLETELALFAKQCDISEEITRAKSHLDGLHKAMDKGDEAGRKLDFILQELNREINTLGAKANNIDISRLVIEVKSELEKMREQAQNVE
ncbi:MAG: YicC/YloC family endoribonuclease [Candidatus Omnitrophota bacterium]